MALTATVIIGDNRKTLKTLPDQSVQTVITSPPYWGLRDYGTGEWIGGDPECSHRRDSKRSDKTTTGHKNEAIGGVGDAIYKDICPKCGAKREDLQIGLEISPDEYVEQLCQVFDEVWRVLKDDGTLWLNIGDTYSSFRDSKSVPDNLRNGEGTKVGTASNRNPTHLKAAGLKHKDLVGIPWRVAFALQARGWYLRQDIIWAKPNPMPESVTDRCTKSHEYIFLLSKNPRYYFDNQSIKEESVEGGLKNKRNIWTVPVKAYREAHFATYPPELILPCVLGGSKEGDLILDPFNGSGTTGEVALQNNRNYIGLELNPEYAQIAERRLNNAVGMFGTITITEGN